MTAYGLNDALLRAFIVHGPADPRQAPGQRRFADEDPRPELFEEFRLGHHAVTMLDEVGEHLERFGSMATDSPDRRSSYRVSSSM